MILLNTFLNFKSKHIMKDTIAQIEKKQVKLTCESNPSEDPNVKKHKLRPIKKLKLYFLLQAI